MKRFIAGASCPGCGEIDKLHVFSRHGESVCECVRCGYSRSSREFDIGHRQALADSAKAHSAARGRSAEPSLIGSDRADRSKSA